VSDNDVHWELTVRTKNGGEATYVLVLEGEGNLPDDVLTSILGHLEDVAKRDREKRAAVFTQAWNNAAQD
jgi:hypothetical protein